MTSVPRSIARLLLLLLAALLISALLAPPIFYACEALAATGYAPFLVGMPFYRVFGRILQISAILAFIPTILQLKVRRLSDVGILRNSSPWRDIFAGLGIVVVIMAILGACLIGFDVYRLRESMDWAKFGRVILTAIFVSGLEEVIFRGILFGLLLRVLQTLPSAVISSVLFAAVHFLKPAKVGPAADEVTWTSGFSQILGVFGGGIDGRFVLGGMVTLFIAGMILAYATRKTRSLCLPFGIHAGWILAQQGLDIIARYRVRPPDDLWPLIGPAQVSGMVPIGWLPVAALAVTALCVWIYASFGRRSPLC